MSSIFLTGDRSIVPVSAIGMLVSAMAQVKFDVSDKLYTGDQEHGIERAVRFAFGDSAEVFPYYKTSEGRTNFEHTYSVLSATIDKFIFVHPNGMSTRMGSALLSAVDPNKIWFVNPLASAKH